MDWTEIIAEVDAKDTERAENIAVMTVPYGIYIEDYSSLEEEVLEIAKIDLIDEELLAKNRETARIHIYISPEDNPAEATAFLEERFRAENINFKILTDKCDVEACLDNWKKRLAKSCLSALYGVRTMTLRAELSSISNQALLLEQVLTKRPAFALRLSKNMLVMEQLCLMLVVVAEFWRLHHFCLALRVQSE